MSSTIEIPTTLGGFINKGSHLVVKVDDGEFIPQELVVFAYCEDGRNHYKYYDRDDPLWRLIESQIDDENIEDVVNDRREQE